MKQSIFDKKVLDHGFIRLVDYMGDDTAIVQAARVSYGEGTKKFSDDRGLIRYLMRHNHSTPFEIPTIVLHVKLPIFVARQWMRHRMASYNEVSGRYSVMKDEFYVPSVERMSPQDKNNKQGSSEEILEIPDDLVGQIFASADDSFSNYQDLVSAKLNRETSRIVLPLSTYTEFYFKIDLHNLFHFIELRLDKHAQYEIRVYAEAIAEFVKTWVPHAWEAFVDYRLEAVTLSRMEVFALSSVLSSHERDRAEDADELEPGLYGTDGFIPSSGLAELGMSRREVREFLENWK